MKIHHIGPERDGDRNLFPNADIGNLAKFMLLHTVAFTAISVKTFADIMHLLGSCP